MRTVLVPAMLAIALWASPASAMPDAEATPAPSVEKPADFDMTKVARFGFGNILMGGWTAQDGWVTAEDLQGRERFHLIRLWGGEQCRVYGMGGLRGEGVMSAMRDDHPGETPLTPGTEFFFETQSAGKILKEPSGLLSIVCPWEVQPRQPAALALNSAVYGNIVKKYLASRGLNVGKPAIVQLFKTDLEGDGVDEVVIAAQNIVSPEGKSAFAADTPLANSPGIPGGAEKGAYSVVLMRKLVGDKVLELPLHEYLAPNGSTPEHNDWRPPVIGKVHQFADLNGDGVLEIVVGTAFYEGYSYHAYEMKGGELREVLSCGAGN